MSGRSARQDPDPTRVETIDLVLALSFMLGSNLGAVAAEHGLTPAQARAVVTLAEPAPMRALAAQLSCDKSNVTGIVDELEKRGFMARQTDPHDRRVKQLVFTDAGRELRRALRARLYDDAPAISTLTHAEEAQLHALLRRAMRGTGTGPPGAGGCDGVDAQGTQVRPVH
jgi:DNA-binding MarR family transcriptional regulator